MISIRFPLRRTFPAALTFAFLLVCSSTAPPAFAGQAFTLEQVRSYVFPESLVSARTGSTIAWTTNDRGRRNVWVAGGPDFLPRQLTAYDEDDGQEITSLSLSADGANVVYVRGGEHGGNWEKGLPVNALSHPQGTSVEIWSVPSAGGPPRKLAEGDYPVISPDNRRVVFLKDGAAWVAPIDGASEAKKLFTARGTTESPVWSPDGSRLAFVSARDSHSYIGVYTDERTPILWIAPETARDGSPRWSPDSRRLAFIRRDGDGGAPLPMLQFNPRPWSIWVADAATGTAAKRWQSGPTLRDSPGGDFFDWAAGGRLIFLSYHDGWQHLYSLPESGGAPLLLTPGDYMVEDVALSQDRKQLVFNANSGSDRDDIDRRHLFKVPVDRAQPRALTSGTGLEWAPAFAGSEQIVFISATAQRPPVLATLAGNGAIRLLQEQSIPADFPSARLVTPKKVTFQAADGVTVHGQLFAAQGGAKKKPAVVYLHGGPQRQMLLGWHYRGYYTNHYAVNQYLAQRGFVVLSLNYRLGPGYGHDFHFPKAAGQRGASEYQDVVAAGNFLRSLPQVDAQRIGLYGGSYGGYLTAMGLAHDSALFKAGVDIHGVHDWVMAFGLKDLFVRKRYELTPDAERALEVGWKSSPVSAVATWKSPVLFITGDDDRNVRASQTVDIIQRLKDTGVHYETLMLVDETHSMHRHESVLETNRATVEFLERFLAEKR